jgi:hypothetical protein
MTEGIINKVEQSGIITINPEEFKPSLNAVDSIDLKPFLFQELILKEKDFREQLHTTDFSSYAEKIVFLYCSADAIIPNWAYMLLTSALLPFAKEIYFGKPETWIEEQWINNIKNKLNAASFTNHRVVVKGCGDEPIPVSVYITITSMLQAEVQSLMYGEPCSTVPVYKKKKL